MRIKFPGKTDKEADLILDQVWLIYVLTSNMCHTLSCRFTAMQEVNSCVLLQINENWKFHKPRIASYWLVKLDSIKRAKVFNLNHFSLPAFSLNFCIHKFIRPSWCNVNTCCMGIYRSLTLYESMFVLCCNACGWWTMLIWCLWLVSSIASSTVCCGVAARVCGVAFSPAGT